MERNIRLGWQNLVKIAALKRKTLRFTQEQLAILAEVSKPTLNRFEQGDTSITLKSAIKILGALGLD